MIPKPVTLLRRFEASAVGLAGWAALRRSGADGPTHWHDILAGYRVLILADPGAGKTFEAKTQAHSYVERDKRAFFIRLENLSEDFESAFEVGDAESFAEWLASGEEAWFFLDSVDEAQLDAPNALEDALRIFGSRIRDARERAHITITTREDAWQALPKRALVFDYLPHNSMEMPEDQTRTDEPADGMSIFRLQSLNLDEMKMFAVHQGVGDVAGFVDTIQRRSLIPMAQNPFDLLALCRVWQADQALGSRLDVIDRMIDLQLGPQKKASLAKFDVPRRRRAASILAAAVTLTGKSKVACPDGSLSDDRIDSATLLQHFETKERADLLATGVFDDKVYGAVRFRHREIRERLTAEWALALMETPEGREQIKDLCIREQYGERVLVPRFKPILPWLILFDEALCEEVLAIDPSVASTGGDPSKLPLDVRKQLLAGMVDQIVERQG